MGKLMNVKEAHLPLNETDSVGSHQNLLSFIHRHDVYINTLKIASGIRMWTLEHNCLGMHCSLASNKLHDPGQ